jgi:anthranilate synthase component 1
LRRWQRGFFDSSIARGQQGDRAYVLAGGSWASDSVPDTEYQETVNKAKAMFKAVALAKTFAP